MAVRLTYIYDNPPALLQEGASVRHQMLLLFEHRREVAPVLDLECPYVSDGILEPVRLLQCLYRHVSDMSISKAIAYMILSLLHMNRLEVLRFAPVDSSEAVFD